MTAHQTAIGSATDSAADLAADSATEAATSDTRRVPETRSGQSRLLAGRAPFAGLGRGLRATLPAWIVAHLIVIAVSWSENPARPLAALDSWDSINYLTVARRLAAGQPGYYTTGNLLHFFPLTPVCAALLSFLTRLPVDLALFGLCWATALLFGATVFLVAERECGEPAVARRAAWLSQLAPGAFVLVMGYSEPLAGIAAAVYFLAIRRGRTGWAVTAGLLAGISRPTGLLLALPGLIEGIRVARAAGWGYSAITKAAVRCAAPVLGIVAYLAYSRIYYGGWLTPFSQQLQKGNRAAVLADPFQSLWTLLSQSGQIWRSGGLVLLITVPTVYLLWVVGRRMPVSYLLWSLAMFVLTVGTPSFASYPRYIASIFPLFIAAALAARQRWQWVATVTASSAMMAWAAILCLHWGTVP